MEVILLEKIRSVGALGEKVKVKSGYGRNYLIPQGKAVFATAANLKEFEARRAELEKVEAEALKAAGEVQKSLEALGVISITARSGEEGKLFGSIGTRDIADAISTAGVAVHKNQVILSDGALRQTGDYEVEIELHGDLNGKVKISIVPEAQI